MTSVGEQDEPVGLTVEEITQAAVIKGLQIQHQRGLREGLIRAAAFLENNLATIPPSERYHVKLFAEELRKHASEISEAGHD